MDGPLDELRKRLEEADADDEAQALRERVTEELTARLAENGLRLSIHQQFGGDQAGLGFATITEMAAELAEGAVNLYRAGLWYSGAALIRQHAPERSPDGGAEAATLLKNWRQRDRLASRSPVPER